MNINQEIANYAEVAVAAPINRCFTYSLPEGLKILPGARVVVPFHHRKVVGYCLGEAKKPDEKISLKNVIELIDEVPTFSPQIIKLIKWISDYYCSPIGEICKAALPKALTLIPKKKKKAREIKETIIDDIFGRPDFKLTKTQESAISSLKETFSKGFSVTLLHGVTGSGKTEVYLKCFNDILAQGKQVLYLVPEIGLTPQLLGYVQSRFGSKVAVYHSGLTDAQRLVEWKKIKDGNASIAVGTRSALFAPFRSLGLIVVDEEHDPSYKQEEAPRYNGRDSAIMRGKIENIPVILGSATPSLESYQNALKKKYNYIEMNERPSGAKLPEIELVDLCGVKKGSILAPYSLNAIAEALNRKEQVMIFLNKRGFASFVICNECGNVISCPNCSISLSYHSHNGRMICHYCDHFEEIPSKCPECKSASLKPLGIGTEKIEMELKNLFPHARVHRMDRDSVAKRGSRHSILSQMKKKEIDILIGTQMITKGHDFPGVTLVVVVDSDMALNFPDFRSSERTFQLLSQVAGRSGRADKEGSVIIQTYNKDHHAITSAKKNDFKSFCSEELKNRKELCYPPFGKLALIRVQGIKEPFVKTVAEKLAATISGKNGTTILGPAPAAVSKVRNKHRWQILVKSPDLSGIRDLLAGISRYAEKPPKGTNIVIDVDPVGML